LTGGAQRADHLVRSSESVVRNIAEGAGRWSQADGAKHNKIARGEAMECAACLHVPKLRKLIVSPCYDDGIRLLQAVVAMLTKMIGPSAFEVQVHVAVKVHDHVNHGEKRAGAGWVGALRFAGPVRGAPASDPDPAVQWRRGTSRYG
jgi:four helix bundle protein